MIEMTGEDLFSLLTPGVVDVEGLISKNNEIVTFCSPYSYYVSFNNKEYINLLRQFNYVFCDGALLVSYLNRFFGDRYRRQSFDGNSIAEYFFKEAQKAGKKIAFVGGEEGVASGAAEVVNGRFGEIVMLTEPGYFPGGKEVVFRKILENDIDIVVVGMGVGAQEKFIVDLKAAGWEGLGITCGGYFDQIVDAGAARYYPELINKLNLRAPYRFIKEPNRLGKRYFIEYMPFYRRYLSSLLRVYFGGGKW